jgi:RNA recognition motif-containing protein
VSTAFHDKKLFIKNLSFRVDADLLREQFSKFGQIISCDVPPNHERPENNQGIAFIEFDTAENASRAKEFMD